MTTKTMDQNANVRQHEEVVSHMDSAVGAAFMASGVGSLLLGILIVLAEANADFKTFLTWNAGVGSLSGKVGLAVIAFVVSWVALHFFMRERHIRLMTSFIVTIVLVALGFLLTYPPVFLALAGK